MTTEEVRKHISEMETENTKLRPVVKANRLQSLILLLVGWAIFIASFTVPRLIWVAVLAMLMHFGWEMRSVKSSVKLRFNERLIEIYQAAINLAPHIAIADSLALGDLKDQIKKATQKEVKSE